VATEPLVESPTFYHRKKKTLRAVWACFRQSRDFACPAKHVASGFLQVYIDQLVLTSEWRIIHVGIQVIDSHVKRFRIRLSFVRLTYTRDTRA
jgi:hypothetical protein